MVVSHTQTRMQSKTRTLTGLALFTAIVSVLQLMGTFVKLGPFSISLTLIPIVVGAAVYGPKAGAYLGGVFGVVVLIGCISGGDAGGAILWNTRPFITAVLCLAKGALAGWAAGGIFAALSRKNMTAGSILSAIICPAVNTGIFCLALVFLYHDTLLAWAGGTSVVYYLLTGLVGVNFLLELGVNMIVSPIIVRIVKARK